MLSTEEEEVFRRDGVIVVRQLIQGDALKEAQKVADDVSSRISRFGTETYQNIEFYNWKSNPALKHVALHSKASQIASQLIHSNPTSSNASTPVRVLKDAVLCFGPKSSGLKEHTYILTYLVLIIIINLIINLINTMYRYNDIYI